MDYLDTTRVVNRVISEVGGTIATSGIQELSHEERGGISNFSYVLTCLYSTAYNAVRAMPGFDMSYHEFCLAVARATESSLGR